MNPERTLDASRLRAARLALKADPTDIARDAGLTTQQVARLETPTNSDGNVTLSQASALAAALGHTLGDLLTPEQSGGNPLQENGNQENPTVDARMLAALLVRNARRITAESAAHLLGWNRARLVAAVRDLNEMLKPTGLAVHHRGVPPAIGISSPHPAPDPELFDQDRMSPDHYQALSDARAGRPIRPEIVAELERAGLIESGNDGRVRLTVIADASLDPHHPGAVPD